MASGVGLGESWGEVVWDEVGGGEVVFGMR